MERDEQPRYLIVNADDFGLTRGVNRGIIEARERGILTSASLMVRSPSALEAAEYARDNPAFSIGLHFDAAEWRCSAGEWSAAYEVIDVRDSDQVRKEFRKQMDSFATLVQRAPTHIDSHQHVHMSEPARAVLLETAKQLGIPLRSCTGAVVYQGGFYGQTGEGEAFPDGISLTRLKDLIETTAAGWTELGCHPGYSDDLDSVYNREREGEIQVLCSVELREAIAGSGILLRSFSDFNQQQSCSNADTPFRG